MEIKKKRFGGFNTSKLRGYFRNYQVSDKEIVAGKMEDMKKADELKELMDHPGWNVYRDLMSDVQKQALHDFRYKDGNPKEENGVLMAFERLQIKINEIFSKGNLAKSFIKTLNERNEE